MPLIKIIVKPHSVFIFDKSDSSLNPLTMNNKLNKIGSSAEKNVSEKILSAESLIKNTKGNNLVNSNSRDGTVINSSKIDLELNSDDYKKKKIRAGEFVFMEGDHADFLYYVISGEFKTYKANDLGQEYIIEFYQKDDLVGWTDLFSEESGVGKYSVSAIAVKEGEVAVIPKDFFINSLPVDRDIILKLMCNMANQLQSTKERLLKLAYNSSKKRIAEALLYIAKKHQAAGYSEEYFHLNREHISSMAAVSPESVSRNLTLLKNEGLIEIFHRNIKILDLKKMENI